MPISDDESSAFGVLSVPSDSEYQWDDNASQEDYGYQSSASLRMPALDNVGARFIAAPKDTFEQFQLPKGGASVPAELEVVIFAPLLAARTISASLKSRSAALKVKALQFNGTGLWSLDSNDEFEATVSTLAHRIGVLYYPSNESYDPVSEHALFVAKYHQIPCIALSDTPLDPFCLNASKIVTTSERHLMAVKTFEGRSARIPIALKFFNDMSISALLPDERDGLELVPITKFNRNQSTSWFTLVAGVLTLLSTLSLFFLHLSPGTQLLPLPLGTPGAPGAPGAHGGPLQAPHGQVPPAQMPHVPVPPRTSTLFERRPLQTPAHFPTIDAPHEASTVVASRPDVLSVAYGSLNHVVNGAVGVVEYALAAGDYSLHLAHAGYRYTVDAIKAAAEATAAAANRALLKLQQQLSAGTQKVSDSGRRAGQQVTANVASSGRWVASHLSCSKRAAGSYLQNSRDSASSYLKRSRSASPPWANWVKTCNLKGKWLKAKKAPKKAPPKVKAKWW